LGSFAKDTKTFELAAISRFHSFSNGFQLEQREAVGLLRRDGVVLVIVPGNRSEYHRVRGSKEGLMDIKRSWQLTGLMLLGVLAMHANTPSGWFLSGSKPHDFTVEVDASHGYQGHASASLKCEHTSPDGFGTLMQSILADEYKGKKVRLSGFVKSDEVTGWSGLWLRVDHGKDVVAFDNMQGRPIKGTQDWQRYDVVLEVPQSATQISFGLLLNGAGKVSLSNTKLDVVGADVPVTGFDPRKLLPKPVNLDFTE
jgi:hypothetical protein